MDIKRTKRIEAEMKKEISLLMANEIKDPRLSAMASITAIELTNDLSQAKIFISVLGDREDKENSLAGLESSKGFIKKELGSRLKLRHIPDLIFKLDETIEHGLYMDKLIDEVIKRDNENRKNHEE
ncbi:30S ribosome-binding factor RbfA [Peptoniphilaceae bacterium SGI.131]